MSGPLPPAVGGMASVLAGLSNSSLGTKADIRLFDTGKKTAVDRSFFAGLSARFALMVHWWQLLAKTDIAHIHTCSGLTFFLDGALLFLAKMRGVSVILHIHGGRFDHFLDGLRFPLANVARWLARRADSVIVLSEDWMRKLVPRLPGAGLYVVENGVAPVVRQDDIPQRFSEVVNFIFLGSLSRGKGVDVLLDAVSMSKLPWNLSLAGGEEYPGFTDWVAARVEELAIANRVSILGPVVGEAKVELLGNADGFVLPSLAEGLPMALLEAMAAGLPVVVTTVGAMPEVIEDGRQGYLVAPADARALADALDRLAADPKLRSSMGELARADCEAKFGVERTVERLSAIYHDLVPQNQRHDRAT